jgi:type VI secretion system protein VasI
MFSSHGFAEDFDSLVPKANREATYESLLQDENSVRFGQWVVTTEKSWIRGVTGFTAFNIATSGSSSSDLNILAIICRKEVMNIGINFSEKTYVSNLDNESVPLLYKIDGNSTMSDRWVGELTSANIFQMNPIPFVKQLMDSKMLFVAVKNRSSTKILEAAFDLEGLAEAIVPLQKACNWR